MNDEEVKIVSLEKVLSERAYILFYIMKPDTREKIKETTSV